MDTENIYSSFYDTTTNIAIDWKETPKSHIIYAYLPGMKREDVSLQMGKGLMEIVGKVPKEEQEEDDKNVTWHIRERAVHYAGNGSLTRKMKLPSDADVDGVKANMRNGVLTVTLPKKEHGKSRSKSIEIVDASKEGLGKKIVKSLRSIVSPHNTN